MGRYKPKQHVYPKEIEFLGLDDVLARSHPVSRKVPGIYFLIDGVEVVYVGQSTNLPVRIHQHRTQRKMHFDRFTVFPCQERMLDKLEGHYIALFNPKFNVVRKGANLGYDAYVNPAEAEKFAQKVQHKLSLRKQRRLERMV